MTKKKDGNQHKEQSEQSGKFQKFLDGFHDMRSEVVNRLAYFSMRVFGYEDISLSDVKRGAYSKLQHKDLGLENAHETTLLLSSAKECLCDAETRRSAITDKCKTLLTMSSILLGLIGLLLPKSLIFNSIWMRGLCFVAIIGLFNVIVLLLTFFAVGRDSRATLDQSEVDLEPKDFEKNRINLYLQCQVALDNRTDYLVDLYKVTRFFFLSSFFFIVILFSISFLFDSMQDDAANEIRKLRSDPELIKLLRGPKGGSGDKGEKGDRGLPGQKGEKGDVGQEATLNKDMLIKHLLDDPQLRQRIEKIIETSRRRDRSNGQPDGSDRQ